MLNKLDEDKVKDLRRMLNEPTAIYWTDYELQKMLDYFGSEFLKNVVNRKIMQDSRICELVKRVDKLEAKMGE
jgi:hypothetical protein